ncbi:hypothetical protein KRX57_02260 [Weeksellaceae bacterium TAE3-ERU29]|nr:hypothetical protein [Weeksellaceae bacterium TAE3-ERU29]
MKKKYIGVIFMVFFLVTLIYNIIQINTKLDILSSENQSQIIGIGASVCGFILGLTLFRFHQIKDKIDNK